MTIKNIGEEGFRWFIGVVEDREDPEKIGRVRVRAYNVHGNNIEAPTSTLPWASVLMPGFSASLGQSGVSATGLRVGSTVVGFFLDGNDALMPIIFGVLPGKNDISQLAQGIQSLNKETLPREPSSAFNAVYPYNKVHQTESGHVVELDDTPNFERLHTYHRSGTYTEINADGRYVRKVVGDDFEIVRRNQTVYINGNVDIQVKGNYTLNVDGNVVINGKVVNINNGTQGAARVGDTADTSDAGSAIGTNKIESGSSTVLIGD